MISSNAYTHLSQSDIAIQIERLVKSIEQYDTPAFRLPDAVAGHDQVQRTRLSRYFDDIQQMIDLFDDRSQYRYSEHLQAFWEACQHIRLERSPVGPVCPNEERTAYLDYHRSMNLLVVKIRQLTCEKWYRRKKDDRRYQSKDLESRVTEYTDSVLDRYARTVVVRVNLYYHKASQARQRAEQVFDDLDRLIAQRERNPIFKYETGYICAVEQGQDRGYHIHAAFFFNGAEVCKDIYKARQIGELWRSLTWSRGYFDSCNQDKNRYSGRLGIGLILRKDRAIRSHVHHAMGYLVKDDQQMRIKPLGARCLRMGQPR